MPTLLDLAPELLLSILLEPQLDYKDLKRTSRVCRKLYKIEQVRPIFVLTGPGQKGLRLHDFRILGFLARPQDVQERSTEL
jgi:hypothetical protein